MTNLKLHHRWDKTKKNMSIWGALREEVQGTEDGRLERMQEQIDLLRCTLSDLLEVLDARQSFTKDEFETIFHNFEVTPDER